MNKQEAIREMNKTFPPEGFTALSTLVLYSGDIIDLKSKLTSIINKIEPEKMVIPRFVAEWIEENKSRFSSLYNVYSWLGFKVSDVSVWVNENQDIFAHAWINGYEVEKEKRYKIIILNPDDSHIMLFKLRYTTRMFFRGSGFEGKSGFECKLTEKEVREHGFGWVFDCEGVKVEEVE